MSTMKAAWLKDWKKVSVEDRPVPEIGHGDALVRVKYAGICGSDLHVYNGHHATAIKPVIMGHEFAGEIAEVGEDGAGRFQPGDRVVVQPYTSCGVCDTCVQGRDNVCRQLRILGIHIDGCFAEYVKVPLKKVYKIPEGVSFRLAALTEPLAVAVHDVRRSRLAVGETALVIGGGPIGLLIAIVARYAGASRVVISEPNKYRIGVAQALGFEVTDPLIPGSEEELMAKTNGEGYDVVFESSGTMPGAALMTRAAKIVGRVIVVGIPRSKPEVDTGAIFAKELDVLGVRIHSQLSFAAAVDVLGKGDLNSELESLITHEYALADIQKAIDFSQAGGEHIKAILKV